MLNRNEEKLKYYEQTMNYWIDIQKKKRDKKEQMAKLATMADGIKNEYSNEYYRLNDEYEQISKIVWILEDEIMDLKSKIKQEKELQQNITNDFIAEKSIDIGTPLWASPDNQVIWGTIDTPPDRNYINDERHA